MAAWHACYKTSTEFTMQQYAIVLNYRTNNKWIQIHNHSKFRYYSTTT